MSRLVAIVLLLAAASWGLGFAAFAFQAVQAPPSEPARAEGIVVLTGGAGRIEAALALLAQDRARLLLITGVAPNLGLAQLIPTHRDANGQSLVPPPIPAALAARITLGHRATSTRGNARETAAWAQSNALHSLIVVTAGYHMRRAIIEIGTLLPGVRLLPYPVLSPALQRPGSLATIRLLVVEYDKFLLVSTGLVPIKAG